MKTIGILGLGIIGGTWARVTRGRRTRRHLEPHAATVGARVEDTA